MSNERGVGGLGHGARDYRSGTAAPSRSRTLTWFARSRPRTVSTTRSPSRTTRSPSASTSSKALAGTPRRVRSDSESASKPRGGRVEGLGAGRRVAAEAYGLDVALRRAHVPRPGAREVAVRRAPDARVLALAPVQPVVARLVAGLRPVRDLLEAVARSGQTTLDALVAARHHVVVGVSARVVAERRAGLGGERVGAHVRRGRVEAEHVVEGSLQVLVGLVGVADDEVHVPRVEADLGDGAATWPSAPVPCRRPRRAEHARARRLDPEADPRHARRRGRPRAGRRPRPRGCTRRSPRRPRRRSIATSTPHRSVAASLEGVPPPKKTELAGRIAPVDRAARELEVEGLDVGADQVVAVGPGGEGAVVAARPAERARARRPRTARRSQRVDDPGRAEALADVGLHGLDGDGGHLGGALGPALGERRPRARRGASGAAARRPRGSPADPAGRTGTGARPR